MNCPHCNRTFASKQEIRDHLETKLMTPEAIEETLSFIEETSVAEAPALKPGKLSEAEVLDIVKMLTQGLEEAGMKIQTATLHMNDGDQETTKIIVDNRKPTDLN